MASEENSLWVNIPRAKYLKGHSFFQHELNPAASGVWKGIVSARGWILKGACFQLGDKSNISTCFDLWLLGLSNRVPKAKEGVVLGVGSKVANFKAVLGNGWNVDRVQEVFSEEEAHCILNTRWPTFDYKDKLIWIGNKSGGFLVRSCLELNTSNLGEMVYGIWEKLWKTKLQPRLKMFMWRVLAAVLPTRDVVGRRLGFGDPSCGVCGVDQE